MPDRRDQEEKSMSCTISQDSATSDLEKWFLQDIHPLIPMVVSQACADLGHYPGQLELNDFVQGINVLLLRGSLRSFGHRSKVQTWLYTIARRHILRQLQERSKTESLDDMPFDSSIFMVQPDQEKRLFAKEKAAILQAALSQLTRREQKLLGLRLQERSVEEIAKEMGIKRRSVSRRIIAVTEKLQRIARENRSV
jgi:RNA polymerase sigma factor (sigma-70 family)